MASKMTTEQAEIKALLRAIAKPAHADLRKGYLRLKWYMRKARHSINYGGGITQEQADKIKEVAADYMLVFEHQRGSTYCGEPVNFVTVKIPN